MKTVKTIVLALSLAGLLASGGARAEEEGEKGTAEESRAGNCYICDDSSQNGCMQCPFTKDTAGHRRGCKQAGCSIAKADTCSLDPKVKTCEPAR